MIIQKPYQSASVSPIKKHKNRFFFKDVLSP